MKSRSQKSGVRSQERPSRRAARTWLTPAFVMLLAIIALAGVERRTNASARGVEAGSAELYQALLDLQNPWTVMCVAAHPDDEDGATLTVLRRKYGVHTVTVFATYGEGGQNAVGPELYEDLGAIRARETAEASEIQGSEPHFLALRDFGFSKSADEAFRVWGREEALRRMVLKIRQLRPDVIITNHDTTSGHGHHQATGRLIIEAFDAAADPRRFPEQLRNGLSVWQPQRLFVRAGAVGGTASKAADDEAGKVILVNRGERDSVRGSTYAEQALSALQRHATQGPWPQTLPASWTPTIRYRLARSAADAAPLPANAQTFLDGLRLNREVTDKLTPLAMQALLPLYRADPRQGILESLIAARKAGVFSVPAKTSERARYLLMAGRLNHALAAASGIRATLTPREDVLVPGTTTRVSLTITNGGESDAHIRSVSLRGLRPSNKLRFPIMLAPGANVTLELESRTPRTSAVTVPRAEHLYDGKLFGEELSAGVNVELDGATFPVNATARIEVAPAVEIVSVTPSPLVLTRAALGDTSVEFSLRLTNHRNQPFTGRIITGGPASKVARQGVAVTLAAKETREVKVRSDGDFVAIDSVRGDAHPVPNVITFNVVGDSSSALVAQRRVRAVWSEARVAPGLRVGYVRSFDDTLRDSLAALGVEARELTIEDVRRGALDKYHALIIDNRGYQAHPELVSANARLLDYVKDGGTLIVFYHRTNEWNPDAQKSRPQLAPYPLTLGNSRVTDETAAIEFSDARHPLLNYPNKIGPGDFAGWIQERGLYYPQEWDAHYSAPLAMSDPGEAPLRGGLLAADYGRGRYIYTSMVWYRQLRAGVPGAYRVLANMISYGRPGKE